MGLFDALKDVLGSNNGSGLQGIINKGGQKKTGGHDHRTNTGDDRTPAQKEGDKKRRG